MITPAEREVLSEKWGQPRVENAMETLDNAVDYRGIFQPSEVTRAKVEAVLKAVYGESE